MGDLDTLRPEVAQALGFIERNQKYGDGSVCAGDIDIIRAELVRLAEIEKERWSVVATRNAAIERSEKAEAELAESRETLKRLNRRVQVAEAGVAEKVKASAPGSLGRALANAAASKAEAELAALKARIADAPRATLVIGQSGDLIAISAEDANDWGGKSVRLLAVEE